jgi:serine/threonine protein kinase
MIGQTLGHYRIEEKLGEGGMGEVYRARDTVLGREVAVKVLPADKVRADRLQRFLREARAASQINHPNVVAIHEITESNGVHFIVMEYVAAKTRRRRSRQRDWKRSKCCTMPVRSQHRWPRRTPPASFIAT